MFVLPGFLLFLAIVAYPVIYAVVLSFSNFNPNVGGKWEFVGLLQYKTMFCDPLFWHSLKNNIIVVFISVFGQIPIGFTLAYILYRKLIKGGKFYQTIVFLPNFLSMIVVGTLWKRFFQADGPVSKIIQIFSGDPFAQFEMMLHPNQIMVPIGFALIWLYSGLYMVIFLANLQKIDQSLFEAAMIDGASERQIFTKIIIPMLSGVILICSIFAISGSLKGFDLIYSLTTEGLQRNNAMVLSIFMYQTAFKNYNNPMRFAYGTAISNAIVVLSILFISISNFLNKKIYKGEE